MTTMIVSAVIAVALLAALTVWRSRTPNSPGSSQPDGDGTRPGTRGGPAGSDRFGGGFGGGWDGSGGG